MHPSMFSIYYMYRFAAPIIYLHTTAHPSSLPTRIQYAHCSCMYALDIKVKEPDFEAMKRNEIKYHRFLFTLAPKYAARMHSFHTYSHSCAHLHAVYPCKPCVHILYAHIYGRFLPPRFMSTNCAIEQLLEVEEKRQQRGPPASTYVYPYSSPMSNVEYYKLYSKLFDPALYAWF